MPPAGDEHIIIIMIKCTCVEYIVLYCATVLYICSFIAVLPFFMYARVCVCVCPSPPGIRPSGGAFDVAVISPLDAGCSWPETNQAGILICFVVVVLKNVFY